MVEVCGGSAAGARLASAGWAVRGLGWPLSRLGLLELRAGAAVLGIKPPLGPPPPAPPAPCLARRSTAGQAYGNVDVPEAVIDLLTSVRNYLQVSG